MGNKPIYSNGNVGIVYFDECDNFLLCISIFLKIFISCIINARHYVVLRFKITSKRNKQIFLYLLSLLLSLSLSHTHTLSLSLLHLYLWFYVIVQIHSPMSPEKEQKYIDVDGKFDIDFPGGIITTLILLVIQKSLFLCRCLWRS